MEQDIFYDIDKLAHSEQENLLRKAHAICDKWWFDKLDCKVSFARQQVEGISFEEAMTHFDKRATQLLSLIHSCLSSPSVNSRLLFTQITNMHCPSAYL
jgi:hypothetical protein